MTPQYAGGFSGMQAEPSIAQQNQSEAFDEEAFARAFADAEASRLDMETVQESRDEKDMELGEGVMINESAERLMEAESDQLAGQARLGADLIHDPTTNEREVQQQDDPDALARTAAQLLDSVRDNQSDKFQNSQFLELMRQLRDREVMVEGDKIVGANAEENQEIRVSTV